MARMPLRTKVFTTVYDRVAKSVDQMSHEDLVKARSGVIPARPPFSWVTGRVYRDVRISKAQFAARDGLEIPVRAYEPAGGRGRNAYPVVVFLHGGGWALGNVRSYDSLCTFISHAVGAVVLSVDYRLAPEAKAPQAALDCVDGVRWAGEAGSRFGADTTRLAVCGDSAGGNLAAVVAQVVRDDGGPAIAHQALLYPGTDATKSYPSIQENADGPILSERDIDGFLEFYVGGSGLALTDPLVSPLWADDLSGLPPALVQTGELDPLRDEGQAYAHRLAEAGVPVRSTTYLGAPHGFMSFPGFTTCGAQARLELATELRRHLL